MNDTTTTDQLPTEIAPADRLLTAAEFQNLADVPPEVEWFANLSNPNTRRAYEAAVKDLLCRHPTAGGIPHRDARASDRLARRAAAARPRRRDDPASARVGRLAVRISL
jgi:hypothetical protein